MQPRIVCKTGTGTIKADFQTIQVNAPGTLVEGADFKGRVGVTIVDYLGPHGEEGIPNPPEVREGITWSIDVEAQFLGEEVNADELMWGNTWEHPIRDILPFGTSAGLKFVQLIDPELTTDLQADQPWALSPWLATSNYIFVRDSANSSSPPIPLPEDATPLLKEQPEGSTLKDNFKQRKQYMANPANRKALTIDSSHIIHSEFSNGFIDFKTLSLKLPIGLSFPLLQYWDGQPVTFVLRNRSGSKVYVWVTLEIVPEPEEDDEGDEGEGDVEETEISEDVD